MTASVVLAGTALSGVIVGPPQQARAALVATGVPDSATVKHDQTLVWGPPGVLGNDLNLLGSSRAILVSGVSHGTLDLDSDGGFTYAPAAGYLGTDSFRYRPSGLLSTAAKVTITVTNAAPVASPDAYTWPAGTTLVVGAPGVLTNDADADGDALIAELDGGGISGSFDLDANGGFRYTPGGGFSGSGAVSYRVWDGLAWSATTTISLTAVSPTPTPNPTPRPTPRPTQHPTPTPLPLPVPLPSLPLPLPTSPLPSLPLPLFGESPRPEPEPTRPPTSSAPRPSAEPSASEDGGSGQPRETDPDGAPAARPPSSGGFGGGGSGDGGAGVGEVGDGAAAPVASDAPRIALDEPQLDLGSLEIDLLAGIEIWSVPAATLGVPGILLLVWVALQGVGALAWIPAVRRLRGDEETPAR